MLSRKMHCFVFAIIAFIFGLSLVVYKWGNISLNLFEWRTFFSIAVASARAQDMIVSAGYDGNIIVSSYSGEEVFRMSEKTHFCKCAIHGNTIAAVGFVRIN